jgi:cytochrome P450
VTASRDDVRIEFDHHSEENARCPWPILEKLRHSCPVGWSEAHGGFWVVTKHADVIDGLRDWRMFSSRHDDPGVEGGFGGQSIPPYPFKTSIAETDPPRSLKMREILVPEFSASAVAAVRPNIHRIAAECIEARAAAGTIDLVMDFVNQVPAKATLQMLGMDPGTWHLYALPMHAICHSSPGSPEFEQASAGLAASWDPVTAVVDDRLSSPRDDIVSRVAAATIDGQPVERQTAIELVWTLVMGGLETVTGVLAYSLRYLSQNPAAKERLLADKALIPTASEEFMRYFTPSRGIARTVAYDGEFRGMQMRRGERVLMSLASSNHDEAVFDRPEEIILDRSPNRHLVFGNGVHRCPGDRLAKAELEIVIQEALQRIPDFQVIEDQTTEYKSMPMTTGFVTMPARFTPRPQRPITTA